MALKPTVLRPGSCDPTDTPFCARGGCGLPCVRWSAAWTQHRTGGHRGSQYAGLTQACMNVPRCVSITVWGVRDSDSWRSNENPLLFDGGGNKKAAYNSVLNVLNAAGPTTSPTASGGSTSASPSSPSGGAKRIVGAQSGRCVDVPNASRTNGTQVQIYDCNGQANQRFSLS